MVDPHVQLMFLDEIASFQTNHDKPISVGRSDSNEGACAIAEVDIVTFA
jgi:hypothetical protein